jgi:hypothetical protein
MESLVNLTDLWLFAAAALSLVGIWVLYGPAKKLEYGFYTAPQRKNKPRSELENSSTYCKKSPGILLQRGAGDTKFLGR